MGISGVLSDQTYTGHSVFAGCLHGVAQVALGQPRVLTHDGVGAAAFAVGDGIEHLPVLVLRHDEHVARLGVVACTITKPEGDANGRLDTRSISRCMKALPESLASRAWKSRFSAT